MAEAVRWTRPARPEAVGAVRRQLAEHALRIGADEDVCERIRLAVSEAVTNVVMHAYRHDDEPGDVIVAVEHDDARVTVRVCDDGLGLVPRIDSPGLGLGLGLMAQTADAFDILIRPGGGVEVRLDFELDGPSLGEAAA